MKRRVFFTMILHPVTGWTRVGNAYGSRETARDWCSFVSAAWHGLRTRVAQCTVRIVDGKPDERSRRILDKKFNLEA